MYEFKKPSSIGSCRISMKTLITALAVVAGAGVMAGCAANYQTGPSLVGYNKSIPTYTATGFTNWGEMKEEDARRYADTFITAMCAEGAKLNGVQIWDASRKGHSQLGWIANFDCRKLVKEL